MGTKDNALGPHLLQEATLKLMLRPAYRIEMLPEGVAIRGETRHLIIRRIAATEAELLEDLMSGLSLEEVAVRRVRRESDQMIQLLHQKQLLTLFSEPSTPNSIEERQLGYLSNLTHNPLEAQESIAASRVAVFGLGGTGVAVLEHLVGSGISNYVLIDADRVETSNLNRQYAYGIEDIGRLKVDASASLIRSKRSNARIETFAKFVRSQEDVNEILAEVAVDFAVVCIDSPIGFGSDMVTRACWDMGIPSIFGGVGLERGFFGPVYKKGITLAEPPLATSVNDSKVRRGTKYSFGPTNSLIASLMAFQIIHHLGEIDDLVEYNSVQNVNFRTGAVFKSGHSD